MSGEPLTPDRVDGFCRGVADVLRQTCTEEVSRNRHAIVSRLRESALVCVLREGAVDPDVNGVHGAVKLLAAPCARAVALTVESSPLWAYGSLGGSGGSSGRRRGRRVSGSGGERVRIGGLVLVCATAGLGRDGVGCRGTGAGTGRREG